MRISLVLVALLAACDDSTPPRPDAAVVRRPDAFQIIEYYFHAALSPTTVTIAAGGSADVTVMIYRTGAMGDVNLALDPVPENLTATLDKTVLDKNTSMARLTIGAVSAGSATVTVVASGYVRHGYEGGLQVEPVKVMVVVP